MRSRASDAAIATSRLQSLNCTNTLPLSADADDFSDLMPGMVAIASSTGCTRLRSTSSGVEPWYGRLTKKNGGDASGKDSSGSRTAAIRPMTSIDTKNMIVVTGRRMLSSVTLKDIVRGSEGGLRRGAGRRRPGPSLTPAADRSRPCG